ncbi:MAG: ankyrin repeat domain-containing protein [Spiroplasma sp. hy2]|uniref:ankyrin repeat domain-containing protein n=1 Tax=Spiroplasma sp. hy2 TaxID=2490850 RepID=UPI0038471A87
METNELFVSCHYDKKITYDELNNMEEIPLLSVLVIKNNLDFIELLIWKKPEIINATNKSGNTPLHYACLFDVSDKKIDQEMINEKIKDIDSYLRLISQSKISNDEIEESKNNLLIQFLLENSPKEIINKPNKSGNTPLQLAIYSNNIKAVELFIQKAKELYGEQSQQFKDFINAKNNFNNTPLHFAMQQFGTLKIKNINIIKLLLANGAEINTKNNDNITPLYAASFNNNIKAVELLIKEAKKLYKGGVSEEFKKIINIKSKKYGMSSPIHAAIHQNHIEIVKLLLANGADDNIEMISQSLNCCKENNNNNNDWKKTKRKSIKFFRKILWIK